MGAEVIKVEAIQRIARGSIRPSPGASGYPDGEPGERPWNRSANFNVLSRNKLGITLDLTTSDGAETFKELVNVSDVVFTNYAFGVMDKFGLGYEELRKVKPDIIALFTPGYGNTGPYRTFRSMGMVIDAITGHTALARLSRHGGLAQLARAPSGRGGRSDRCVLDLFGHPKSRSYRKRSVH